MQVEAVEYKVALRERRSKRQQQKRAEEDEEKTQGEVKARKGSPQLVRESEPEEEESKGTKRQKMADAAERRKVRADVASYG